MSIQQSCAILYQGIVSFLVSILINGITYLNHFAE